MLCVNCLASSASDRWADSFNVSGDRSARCAESQRLRCFHPTTLTQFSFFWLDAYCHTGVPGAFCKRRHITWGFLFGYCVTDITRIQQKKKEKSKPQVMFSIRNCLLERDFLPQRFPQRKAKPCEWSCTSALFAYHTYGGGILISLPQWPPFWTMIFGTIHYVIPFSSQVWHISDLSATFASCPDAHSALWRQAQGLTHTHTQKGLI